MVTNDRQYRAFEVRANEAECRVEGYAAIFNSPTVMYEWDGVQYKEAIDAGAFSETQMADVVMNYNHTGKPVARTKNGTLTLTVDSVGLKISADLSGTEEGRRRTKKSKAVI